MFCWKHYKHRGYNKTHTKIVLKLVQVCCTTMGPVFSTTFLFLFFQQGERDFQKQKKKIWPISNTKRAKLGPIVNSTAYVLYIPLSLSPSLFLAHACGLNPGIRISGWPDLLNRCRLDVATVNDIVFCVQLWAHPWEFEYLVELSSALSKHWRRKKPKTGEQKQTAKTHTKREQPQYLRATATISHGWSWLSPLRGYLLWPWSLTRCCLRSTFLYIEAIGRSA